jgi:hypothetical protein
VIDIILQWDGKTFYPFSEDDKAQAAELPRNRTFRAKISGTQRMRSLPQLRAFWAFCAAVADNTDDPNWNTREKVAMQIKLGLQWIDTNKTIVAPNGQVHFALRSISFAELPHMEACNFFERAYEYIRLCRGIDFEEWCSAG